MNFENNEYFQARMLKLKKLEELGCDPYGQRTDGLMSVARARAAFQEGAETVVKCAGRVMALRGKGKVGFVDLRDWSGRIQLFIGKDHVSDEKSFDVYKCLDLGDIVAASGTLGKTQTGELSIFVREFTILSKALLPIPKEHYGIRDVEIRSRKRYLDLFMNQDAMSHFLRRTELVAGIRAFLSGREFVEVETPMMQSQYGGAAAKPFVTHHNALDMNLFLRISPEIYLKKLLVGGMERVYEINRNFRNEGISTRHNPEFTMMEVYQAYSNYIGMLELTESLIVGLIENVLDGAMKRTFGGMEIDFTPPFRRARYADLFREHAGVDLYDEAGVRARVKALGLNPKGDDHWLAANAVFEECVEPSLIDPTFVMDYPVAICPLTKKSRSNPDFAERFELFVAKTEIANAYTELNDPLDQKARFERQLRDSEADYGSLDEDFIGALLYGMPPAGGLGIGIDRLIMVLTGEENIRNVILFPLMRPQDGLAEECEKDGI